MQNDNMRMYKYKYCITCFEYIVIDIEIYRKLLLLLLKQVLNVNEYFNIIIKY